MIQLKQQKIFRCPSEDQTHVFNSAKEFIYHLTECVILKEFSAKHGEIILFYSGEFNLLLINKDDMLKFLVCPKNFYHIKLVKDNSEFTQKFNRKQDFCRCQSQFYGIYSNYQRMIQFKQSEMKDYLKFYFIIEENKLNQDLQTQIVYQDLEDLRIQHLKSQQLTNSIQNNKIIHFKYDDELYQNLAQFRLVKDHQGMKQYIQKHQKIDQQFQIIPKNEINLVCEDQAFIRQSLKPRIIMEVEPTNLNSFRVQTYFNQKNFVSCVRYQNDILLMFSSKKLLNMSNSDSSFFIMSLEKSEYQNIKEREKYNQQIQQLKETYQMKQKTLQSLYKTKLDVQKMYDLTKSNNQDLPKNTNSIMCENKNLLNNLQQSNLPQKLKSPDKNQIQKNQNENKQNNYIRVIKKVNKNEEKKVCLAKKIIVCPKRNDENFQKSREKCIQKIFLLKEKFEFYEKRIVIYERLKKQESILEEEINAIEQDQSF